MVFFNKSFFSSTEKHLYGGFWNNFCIPFQCEINSILENNFILCSLFKFRQPSGFNQIDAIWEDKFHDPVVKYNVSSIVS